MDEQDGICGDPADIILAMTSGIEARCLGPHACLLIAIIGVKGERSPDGFVVYTASNDRLMAMCGFSSRKTLEAAAMRASRLDWLTWEKTGQPGVHRFRLGVPARLRPEVGDDQ